ncbi:calcium proton exchanger [Cystoisospora suis]|uniref:Calcium proton exchanger n=1 Tax=Cystoisospora suis TaxID=483139 RepID=A0A2C6K187_9APIC|nr:calcium proton exchanger [Cystoisospora suis]
MSIVIPTVAAYGSFFTYDINLRSYQPAPPAYYTKKTPYHSPSNGQLHMDTLKSLKEDKEREDDKVNESPTKMPILKSTHNASGEGGDFGMSAANLPTYDIIKISRTIAVLIGLTYCLFLFFQLYTHLSLFRDDECGDEEWPSMSWEAATLLLFIITLLISIHSEYLVGSIHDVVTTYGLPESFIGVILLPIVGNAAEHLTAVTVAMKNKVDLAMGVAVGSSAQIALFVFPFTVCVGWFLDQPLTLAVQPLNALVLLMAVLVAMAIVQDGESNWLEGVMLMSAYLMIAIVFWYNGAAAPPAPPPLPSSSLGGNEDASTYAPGAKNLS